MIVRWSELAVADRRAIYDHIEADDPSAAAAMDELFARAATRLMSNNAIGRIGRVPGTRELVVHRHYILLYEIADETVLILGVLHTSRQWPPL